MIMKYIIYARVSPRGSDFEGETSIPMQIEICKEYIRSQHGEILNVYSDEFFSGKNMQRPAFKEIMLSLESGKAEWDCICVYKLSRMSRSLRDGACIFEQLYKWNKGFVSVTERNLDFSTPTGRAMLGMLQVFNQFEREQTAENTRNKMISIAAKGLWAPGTTPIGYKRGSKGDNKLYVDPAKAVIVKNIFEMYNSPQFAPMDIMKKYPTISRQSLFTCLRNKVYIGKIVYAGKEYQGKHEPIIDESLFNMVQQKLPMRSAYRCRPKAQKRIYLLAGLLRCHCGRYMTPASAKSGRHFYYECTDDVNCKNRVQAIKIEQLAIDTISNKCFNEKIIQASREEVYRIRQQQLERLQPELKISQAALNESKKERDKIIQLMLDGNLNQKNSLIFNARLETAVKNIEQLEAKIEYLQAECNSDIDCFDYVLDAIQTIEHLGQAIKASPDDKDLIRQLLIVKIDKIIEISKGGEFQFIFNFESSTNCKAWHPQIDINELLKVTFTIAS